MGVVVLGGNGFVGSALATRLSELGHEVLALSRTEHAGASVPGLTRAVLPSGLAHPARIAELSRGADALICCAGDHNSRSSARALSWLHVAGVENVTSAARFAGVPRVVLLTCADVTLTGRGRVHWKEDSEIGQRPLGHVARTKLLGEEVALHSSDRKLTVTSIRPALLWGAGERCNLPWICAEGLAGGVRLLGSGSSLLSSAHIDLVVDALIAAASAPVDEVSGKAIHVADPETLTARELFVKLSSALGLPPPRAGIYPVEYARALVRARFGGEGPLPEDVARRACHGLLDCLRAVTLLDLKPRTSFDDGLRALSEWARTAGGPAAIARQTRAPLTDADADRAQAIADEEALRRAS